MPSLADLMALDDDGFRLRFARSAIKRTNAVDCCAMPRSCSVTAEIPQRFRSLRARSVRFPKRWCDRTRRGRSTNWRQRFAACAGSGPDREPDASVAAEIALAIADAST